MSKASPLAQINPMHALVSHLHTPGDAGAKFAICTVHKLEKFNVDRNVCADHRILHCTVMTVGSIDVKLSTDWSYYFTLYWTIRQFSTQTAPDWNCTFRNRAHSISTAIAYIILRRRCIMNVPLQRCKPAVRNRLIGRNEARLFESWRAFGAPAGCFRIMCSIAFKSQSVRSLLVNGFRGEGLESGFALWTGLKFGFGFLFWIVLIVLKMPSLIWIDFWRVVECVKLYFYEEWSMEFAKFWLSYLNIILLNMNGHPNVVLKWALKRVWLCMIIIIVVVLYLNNQACVIKK